MPILKFATGGILPTGIHDCDLAEIESTFVYNSKRQTIWNNFTSYLSQVIEIVELDVIYVDGSFVTDRDLPNDVDIVLEFADTAILQRVAARLPHLFNRHTVKTNFTIDLLFRIEPIPAGFPDLTEFFQYLRPQEAIDRGLHVGAKKGILKMSLNRERKKYLELLHILVLLRRFIK